MQTAKPHRGRFAPGPGPCRHRFTREECHDGFWAAIASIVERYPNACNAGGHMVLHFLPVVTIRRQRQQEGGRP